LLPQTRQGEHQFLELGSQLRERKINILQVPISTSHLQLKGSFRHARNCEEAHSSFDLVSGALNAVSITMVNIPPVVAPAC
jgi:hypothetical protein